MGGKTEKKTENKTSQTDARVYTQQQLDNSFNTNLDVRDESTKTTSGNIVASGPVTITSTSDKVAETATKAAQKMAEQAQKLAQKTTEENRKATEAALKSNGKISEASIKAMQKSAEEAGKVAVKAAELAAKAGTEAARIAADTAKKAAEETRRIAETAVDRVADVSKTALSTNADVISDVLKFLEADGRADRDQNAAGLKFLGDSLKGANDTVAFSLAEAFKSTVGGISDSQQKTMLWAVGLAVAVAAFAIWSANR